MSRLVIVWIGDYSLEHLPHILPKGGALVSVEKLGSKLVCLKLNLPVDPTQIDCQIDWQTADAAVESTVGSLRIQDYKEMDDVQEDSVHSTAASLLTVEENPYKALQIRLGQGLWHTSHILEIIVYQLKKLD